MGNALLDRRQLPIFLVVIGMFLALLFPLWSNAQNLVIDGSLEDTLKCPYTLGRFYSQVNTNERYIADWRPTTRSSSDLHHTCGYNNFMPHSGEGYCGLIFWDPAGTREYATAYLNTPMVAGECYYVEFYTALKDNSARTIDEFQVSFTAGDPQDQTWPPPAPLPLPISFQTPTAITSNTWQKVSFLYTANGGEDAMTFGNFLDNANTTVTSVGMGSVSAYFYLDDVSVTRLELGPDVEFCDGDSAMVVANINCPDLTYSWSNGDTDSITYASSNGTLALTISGNGTCSLTDQVNVVVGGSAIIDAGPDITINQGESTGLTGSGTQNPSWSPPTDLSCTNCLDPVASPNVTTTYVLTGTDPNGCTGQDSVTVTVIVDDIDDPIDPIDPDTTVVDPAEPEEEIYFYVPNAFTPDGNGLNDVFTVVGGPFDEFNLKIFDRWGILVFESEDPGRGWDGSFKGLVAQPDVYVYHLKVKVSGSQFSQARGHVVLIR